MTAPYTVSVSGSSPAKSTPIRVNHFVTPTDAGILARLVSGSATYTVEGTYEDGNAYPTVAAFNTNAYWFPVSAGLTSQTSTQTGTLGAAVMYIRLNATSLNCQVDLTFEQAGV